MAQAEAFETDFWKDANLRKVWDDIVPGEPRKTIPYTLTQGSDRALLQHRSAKTHPIYFDEAYAKTTRLWRADRAAVDPHPPDVLLHAGGRLDALARHRQCRAVLELQHSGAARRRHHAAGPRARQVHQARAAVRGARQCLLQPARRGDLLGPRLDHPAACEGRSES